MSYGRRRRGRRGRTSRRRRRARGYMRRANIITRQPVSIAAYDGITVILYKDYTTDLVSLADLSLQTPFGSGGNLQGTRVLETNTKPNFFLNAEYWLTSQWSFSQVVVVGGSSFNTVSGFQFQHMFTPCLFPGWSNWAALFRKYKVNKCGIKFFPQYTGGMSLDFSTNADILNPDGTQTGTTQRRPYPQISMKFDVNKPASRVDLSQILVSNFKAGTATNANLNGADLGNKIWYWWAPSTQRQCLYEPGWSMKKFNKPRKYSWTPVTTDEYQICKLGGTDYDEKFLAEINKENYKYPEFELVDQEKLANADLDNDANPTFYMGPEFFIHDLPLIRSTMYYIRIREWVSITFRDQKLPNINVV